MDLNKTNAHLTIFLALLFASIFNTTGAQDNPLVKAIQLYDAENFKEAEVVLKKLHDENPDHLMVNYYYGACRTENSHFGSKEIVYLLKGSTGEAPLKTDYYLGVQYHAQSRWEEALKHYKRYQEKSEASEQENVQLAEKIQQCYDEINPFGSDSEMVTIADDSVDLMPAPLPRETAAEEFTPVMALQSTPDSSEVEDIAMVETEDTTEITEIPDVPAPIEPTITKSEPIDFVINGELTYVDTSHFRTLEGKQYYIEGNKKKNELEIRLKEIKELREKYAASKSYDKKQEIGEKILTSENEIYSLQTESQELFANAKKTEIEYWESVSQEEKDNFLTELKAYSKSVSASFDSERPVIDSGTFISSNILLANHQNQTPTREAANDELIYKIQLGAYSRELPNYVKNLFKKLSYIRKIENYTDDKGVVVYTTGNLTNYNDALKMQNQVRQEGVEDAFVVPYFNGKRITLKEAKEIEEGK
ncbi:hypothetical protein [uncultured Draconibacterium sp.]|uniref:hypothetical protein n=1 Tax=uncultured Draconibacterium sp. TaxID=1573823 RepID=UPI003216FA91